MKSPILSPDFKWIPASSHSDPEAFRQRQRARMREAQREAQRIDDERDVLGSIVTPIVRKVQK